MQHRAVSRFQIDISIGGDFIKRDIGRVIGIAHYLLGTARCQVQASVEVSDFDVLLCCNGNVRNYIAVRQIGVRAQLQINHIYRIACVQREVAVRHQHLCQAQLACACDFLIDSDIAWLTSGGNQCVDIGAQTEWSAQVGLQHIGSD